MLQLEGCPSGRVFNTHETSSSEYDFETTGAQIIESDVPGTLSKREAF